LADLRRLSILRAWCVMESLEADEPALPRILAALDAQDRSRRPARTLDAGGRGEAMGRLRNPRPVPGRRHLVHRGRRVGTPTRNGGQWAFRFATPVGEELIQAIAGRIADPPGGRGGDPVQAVSCCPKVAESALTGAVRMLAGSTASTPSLAGGRRWQAEGLRRSIHRIFAQTWQPWASLALRFARPSHCRASAIARRCLAAQTWQPSKLRPATATQTWQPWLFPS
jgi:hypothetical protein